MLKTFTAIQDARLLSAGRELLSAGIVPAAGGYAFNLVDPNVVLQTSPSLVSYLAEKKLLASLIYVGLPYCPASSSGEIHVDGKCAEAINFPVFNCADSDYVWFDADVVDEQFRQTLVGHSAKNGVAEYRRCDADSAKELARISCAQPVWFNTHIPHCGVNRSPAPRVVATLRFSVKLNPSDL